VSVRIVEVEVILPGTDNQGCERSRQKQVGFPVGQHSSSNRKGFKLTGSDNVRDDIFVDDLDERPQLSFDTG